VALVGITKLTMDLRAKLCDRLALAFDQAYAKQQGTGMLSSSVPESEGSLAVEKRLSLGPVAAKLPRLPLIVAQAAVAKRVECECKVCWRCCCEIR